MADFLKALFCELKHNARLFFVASVMAIFIYVEVPGDGDISTIRSLVNTLLGFFVAISFIRALEKCFNEYAK